MGKNFTGHRMWTHLAPSTYQTLTWSLPFFVAGMVLEISWIDLLMSITLNRLASSFMMWHAYHRLKSTCYSWTKTVSLLMIHIIPASIGSSTSCANWTFFFTFSFLILIVSKHNTNSSSSPSMVFSVFSYLFYYYIFFLCNPYSCALFYYSDNILHWIFYFFGHFFLFFFISFIVIFMLRTFTITSLWPYLPHLEHLCLHHFL